MVGTTSEPGIELATTANPRSDDRSVQTEPMPDTVTITNPLRADPSNNRIAKQQLDQSSSSEPRAVTFGPTRPSQYRAGSRVSVVFADEQI